ncbi:MAG: sigma-54-dependent Fis family transcriptional regulator [Steroidobacteraceae bacterium]|nr:sigma-54-dependent Fis family transcriptional regulator [Steroidobacteraceae bacterium]
MPKRPAKLPLELHSLVNQLHGAHIVIDADYQIVAANEAYRETFADGGDVVGRHCYEVSHGYAVPCDEAGELCPRRQAAQSGHFQRVLHVHHTPHGEEYVQVNLYPLQAGSGRPALYVEHMTGLPTARAGRSAGGLVGRARTFVAMMEQVTRVAPTDTAVLLLGETGTGKEMVARAIHEGSSRAHAPFVPVDCSGLAETLVESELFGHEKGAFTGALVRKTGLVEAAAGGTLFLDEVGDIPLGLQVKLLRLLETGTFRRVGGVEPQHTSFRLIAATHRDLLQRVRDERFRADLYYRLAAFPIRLPPLRERREDIALLADSLLSRLGGEHAHRLAPDALDCLLRYDYPGNIRELRNILERASLLSDGPQIERSDLPQEICAAACGSAGGSPLLDAERRAFAAAVTAHGGTRRELADTLGLSERTLYRKLRKLGLG